MVICPDASKAQNSIAAVSAPFDALEAARSGAPPLELLVQSLLVNLSNHDRMRRPPRRHCASHLYIAVRPTPKIRATPSGLSPSCTRRARFQGRMIHLVRAIFSHAPRGSRATPHVKKNVPFFMNCLIAWRLRQTMQKSRNPKSSSISSECVL